MGDRSIGEMFQRLVQDIRRKHLGTCVEFIDHIQAEIELMKQKIARDLAEEYATLSNVHEYLEGDAENTCASIPKWVQSSDGFIIRASCSKEFDKEENKRRLISAIQNFLQEHGFSTKIDLTTAYTRCIIRITITFEREDDSTDCSNINKFEYI